MYECFAFMYVCLLCVCLVPVEVRPLGLESQKILSHYMDAGNQTWIL